MELSVATTASYIFSKIYKYGEALDDEGSRVYRPSGESGSAPLETSPNGFQG
jgi:hypothetical protein